MTWVYGGGIALVIWGVSEGGTSSPNIKWLMLVLFVLFESALWREAYLERGKKHPARMAREQEK